MTVASTKATAEEVESSDCYEKYSGDEINLVPQHLRSLFPFTPTPSPHPPEFQTHYLRALQTFPLECPTSTSKYWQSPSSPPNWASSHIPTSHPNLRVQRYTIPSVTTSSSSAKLQVATKCFWTCLLKFPHLSFLSIPTYRSRPGSHFVPLKTLALPSSIHYSYCSSHTTQNNPA